MTVTIDLDDALINHACKLTGEKDRKKVVEQALNELIRRRSKIESLLELVGKIEFYEGYDYKALRADRHDNS